ncbi:MAG: hypothetical protein K9I74_08035 [Bacteroidales bacterium]|nr:hypothetical protein [Bacteroidales bacterium]
MDLDNKERLELLKMEMQLIQATLEKYDDLIFRNRNWFITIWMGTIGLGFTISSQILFLFAGFISILFWGTEGIMRHKYWYKYVLRYRTLRDHINKKPLDLKNISLYDLTNHFMNIPKAKSIKKSFFKPESLLIYGALALTAIATWCLAWYDVVNFPILPK